MSEIQHTQEMRKGEPSAESVALVKFWLGDHPRPCTCLHGPCEGGENGCGYDPAAWDAWEAAERCPVCKGRLWIWVEDLSGLPAPRKDDAVYPPLPERVPSTARKIPCPKCNGEEVTP